MRTTETIALRREPGHVTRSLVALLLRAGLGLVFLMAGLNKLQEMGVLPTAGAPEAEAAHAEDEAAPSEDDAAPSEDDAPEGEDAPAEAADAPEPAAHEPPARYPETVRGMFADTWLARDLGPALDLHTGLLPYVEVAVGALLILGLLTTLWAFVGGLVLLSLLFGQLVLGNTTMYPNMLIYLLVDAGILWLSPITSNYLSLDGLLFGFFLKPKDEGEFRREYEAPGRRA